MKNRTRFISNALLIATLFAVPFTPAYTLAKNQDVPTKDELATLLKTAKTPLEHHRIAMYYKQEASQARQDAATHSAWGNIYGKGQGAAHCTNLVKVYEQAAKDDDALASMHENMASDAEQK
jgi:hypothetical protein